MKLNPAMHFLLTRLNTALVQGDEATLLDCLNAVDLQTLLSQDTILKVRARNKLPMINFLCTLAVANEVEPARAQVWLDAYHSISTGQPTEGLRKLSANNALRQAVEAQIRKAPLQPADLKNTKGSDSQWHDAFELCVDLRDWVSAVSLLETLGAKRIQTSRWLRIARALSQRQVLLVDPSGIAQVDVDYHRLARLYELCTNAARNANAHEVVRSLDFLRARCLETGGDHEAAIALLRPLDKGRESNRMKVSIARSLCKAGDLAGSIAEIDAALRAFRLEEPREDDDDTPQATAPAPREGFNVAKASQALSDLAQIFRANDLKMFLVSGTLLGYEREGKLLDHDKDIDIGVIGWENQYAICLAIQQSGLFTVEPKYLKGARAYYIPVVHNLTGMCIDMFIYYPQDGQLVTGVDFFFGYRQTFAFTPFDLKPVNFLGVDMYVPDDTPRNLEENFGNWRVPDASYISHLESPSTMDKGGPAFMLTARLTALGALMKDKPVKLRKVIAVLREYAGRPLAMDPALLERLERACEQLERAATPRVAAPAPQLEEACA